MSFILDALKKSEHERHRAATPGLADVAIVRRESRLPMILGVVGALLLINVVALAVLFNRRPASGSPAATTSVAIPATSGAPPTVAPAAATAPTVPAAPVAAPRPAPVPANVAPARDRAPVRPLTSETEEAASDPSLDVEPPPPSAGTAVRHVAPVGRGLPTVDQLTPQATAGLPPLNLDLHVYATDSASRFVMIGGRRYHEGDALESGPLVEQITPEGVVLNYRGNRFLLRHQ